jgi:uncharacterized protein (DUF2141 family)
MNLLLASAFSFLSFVQTNNVSLTITFSGITAAKGQLMVALNDDKGKMVSGHKVPVTKTGEVVFTIQDVKPGSYTLAVFHDENLDEELNTTLVGLPKERYGFSNNARGTFGPPSLSAQTFVLKADSRMKIALK